MGRFLELKKQKEREEQERRSKWFKEKKPKNPFSKKVNSKRIKKQKIDKAKYHKYLNSKKWKLFREMALEFHGRCCGRCGSKFNLEVHHKDYKNIFHESFSDVMILCNSCHGWEHKRLKMKNGKTSRYMRNPNYDNQPTTWYVPKPIVK